MKTSSEDPGTTVPVPLQSAGSLQSPELGLSQLKVPAASSPVISVAVFLETPGNGGLAALALVGPLALTVDVAVSAYLVAAKLGPVLPAHCADSVLFSVSAMARALPPLSFLTVEPPTLVSSVSVPLLEDPPPKVTEALSYPTVPAFVPTTPIVPLAPSSKRRLPALAANALALFSVPGTDNTLLVPVTLTVSALVPVTEIVRDIVTVSAVPPRFSGLSSPCRDTQSDVPPLKATVASPATIVPPLIVRSLAGLG